MYSIVALLTGVAVSLMVVANGQLADQLNLYRATVLIHVIGLLVQSVIMVWRRTDMRLRRGLPLFGYMGGTLGVITVTFTMYAFAELGVAPVIALNLLGMTVTSILYDQFGWSGMRRYPFTRFKAVSLAVSAAGVIILLLPFSLASGLAVLLALLTGTSAVVSRTLNARLLGFYNLHLSTFFNYVTGLLTSVVLLALLEPEAFFSEFAFQSSNWFMYTGGAIGAMIVSLTSVIVVRLSSYHVTVLTFLGQYFFGLILDAILGRMPTVQAVLGGMVVLAGLMVNTLEKPKANKSGT